LRYFFSSPWERRIRKFPKTVLWLLRHGETINLNRPNVWRVPHSNIRVKDAG